MQDKKLTVEDIAIPNTITQALHAWWNNGANDIARGCGPFEQRKIMDASTEAVKVALLSLATNPVVPSDADSSEMYQYATEHRAGSLLQHRYMLMEWQRRMFLRKPDPVPPGLQDLIDAAPLNANEVRRAYALGKAHSNDTL